MKPRLIKSLDGTKYWIRCDRKLNLDRVYSNLGLGTMAGGITILVRYLNEESGPAVSLGVLHNPHGPAFEDEDRKMWFLNGKQHRVGAPALVFSNGREQWFQNGIRHREDGPAAHPNGKGPIWFYQGNLVDVDSQEEFEQWLRLRAFQ